KTHIYVPLHENWYCLCFHKYGLIMQSIL
ncbi:hypothetical protein, partial [Plasmodium yoelii yoelii]